jgi:hypothetical protein
VGNPTFGGMKSIEAMPALPSDRALGLQLRYVARHPGGEATDAHAAIMARA